jgi:hypothetical protein
MATLAEVAGRLYAHTMLIDSKFIVKAASHRTLIPRLENGIRKKYQPNLLYD